LSERFRLGGMYFPSNQGMPMSLSKLSRRSILAAGATGGVVVTTAAAQAAGIFGNPDLPPQGAINATAAGVSDPGPQNPAMANNEQPFIDPPATDVGGMPQFWSSFNIAPRRQQAGGWARQVNTDLFPLSKDIAGVNMRLDAGGIRELHWHQQAEWAESGGDQGAPGQTFERVLPHHR
jgi:oxalate decarboxylase